MSEGQNALALCYDQAQTLECSMFVFSNPVACLGKILDNQNTRFGVLYLSTKTLVSITAGLDPQYKHTENPFASKPKTR